ALPKLVTQVSVDIGRRKALGLSAALTMPSYDFIRNNQISLHAAAAVPDLCLLSCFEGESRVYSSGHRKECTLNLSAVRSSSALNKDRAGDRATKADWSALHAPDPDQSPRPEA